MTARYGFHHRKFGGISHDDAMAIVAEWEAKPDSKYWRDRHSIAKENLGAIIGAEAYRQFMDYAYPGDSISDATWMEITTTIEAATEKAKAGITEPLMLHHAVKFPMFWPQVAPVELLAWHNGNEVVVKELGDVCFVASPTSYYWVGRNYLQPAQCTCQPDGPVCRACQDWSEIQHNDEMPF